MQTPLTQEHEEEITRQFDPVIIKRLLGFVRPCLPLVFIALLCLLLGTISEMLTPIIIQRAVDQHLFLPEYHIDLTKQPAAKEIVNAHPGLFTTHAPDKSSQSGQLVIKADDLAKLPLSAQKVLRSADYEGLWFLSLLFIFVEIGVAAFGFGEVYFTAYIGQRVMKDLRVKMLQHTLNFSLKYIDANPLGKLVTRITSDVESINDLFTSAISALLKDFCLMAGALITLLLLNPLLALTTLLILPVLLVIIYLFRTRARHVFRRLRVAISSLNGFLAEHLAGIQVTQLFTQENFSYQEFKKHNQTYYKTRLGEMYVNAFFRPLLDLLSSLAIALVLYFGARAVSADILSLGVLIAFINLIKKFFGPFADFSDKYTILQSAMAGGERIFALLDTKESIPDAGAELTPDTHQASNQTYLGSQSYPIFPIHEISPQVSPAKQKECLQNRPKGKIEFRNVSFSYQPDKPVLDGLSFTIEPGETVAIVGHTGAGKSTIISLLTRFWDVSEGRILLDDMDIRELPLANLRRNVLAVLQEVFLFTGSIADNIRLGSPIADEKVREAARLVRADTFIEQLPEGFNTHLHERGNNLSMGQQQLLAFARVIAHQPEVLVLDEATGHIDTETERLIQQALQELLKGRTSLVIAHRLSTIKHAHKILVLHKGKLAEEGTHHELLKAKGLYYKLHKMQYMNDA